MTRFTSITRAMGFPCPRVAGAFFASCDHRAGDLIVRLPTTASPISPTAAYGCLTILPDRPREVVPGQRNRL